MANTNKDSNLLSCGFLPRPNAVSAEGLSFPLGLSSAKYNFYLFSAELLQFVFQMRHRFTNFIKRDENRE